MLIWIPPCLKSVALFHMASFQSVSICNVHRRKVTGVVRYLFLAVFAWLVPLARMVWRYISVEIGDMSF
ncbi:hypothetical protein BJX70DRAFT_353790 [Aspergillus crustosus]